VADHEKILKNPSLHECQSCLEFLQNSTKSKQSTPNPNIPKIKEKEQQILIKIAESKEAAASSEHYKGASYQYILGNQIQMSSTSSEFLILQTCDTKP
jgi:hypothetical protein